MNGRKLFYLAAVFLFPLCQMCMGGAIFTMSADKHTLDVGETAVIGIYGFVEEATGLNGINIWQLDMAVDTGGIVQVNNVQLMAPSPWATYASGYLSVNSGLTGNVAGLGASAANVPADSTVGVGSPTLLANVTIEALSAGTVTYELTAGASGFYTWLRDYFTMAGPLGNDFDLTYGNLEFQAGNNVFVVTPEPGTLMMLAGLTALALRRRRA